MMIKKKDTNKLTEEEYYAWKVKERIELEKHLKLIHTDLLWDRILKGDITWEEVYKSNVSLWNEAIRHCERVHAEDANDTFEVYHFEPDNN